MDHCDTIINVSQLNTHVLILLVKWLRMNGLYSRTQKNKKRKKKKKIISDKQRYRQMTDHSRGGSTGAESYAGLMGLLSATGSLLSGAALRV